MLGLVIYLIICWLLTFVISATLTYWCTHIITAILCDDPNMAITKHRILLAMSIVGGVWVATEKIYQAYMYRVELEQMTIFIQ